MRGTTFFFESKAFAHACNVCLEIAFNYLPQECPSVSGL